MLNKYGGTMIKLANLKLPYLAVIMLLSLSFLAKAELPKASMDDYVWEIIEPKDRNSVYEIESCEGDSHLAYQHCNERIQEQRDNSLSAKWRIADRVFREKDTLYIDVPNRLRPLTFRDYNSVQYEDASYNYQLSRYDKTNQLLILEKHWWETTTNILVNLKTGFTQEFEGDYLSFSPDMQYAAAFELYPDSESVMILEKDKAGIYVFKDMDDDNQMDEAFRKHLAFYGGDSSYLFDVKPTWLNNHQLMVDFYHKMNHEDTAAYRVRFNFAKPNPQENWQIIPIK